jgi:hypothetical protein
MDYDFDGALGLVPWVLPLDRLYVILGSGYYPAMTKRQASM